MHLQGLSINLLQKYFHYHPVVNIETDIIHQKRQFGNEKIPFTHHYFQLKYLTNFLEKKNKSDQITTEKSKLLQSRVKLNLYNMAA